MTFDACRVLYCVWWRLRQASCLSCNWLTVCGPSGRFSINIMCWDDLHFIITL